MSVLKIAGYKKHSFVDGPGVRFTVFTQGCPHACPGCHNPETWDAEGGFPIETEDLVSLIRSTKYLDGVTLSGGDPLLQAAACAEIVRAVREEGLSVWMYTGYTYEQIRDGVAGNDAIRALREIDVLVDGRFIQSRRDASVLWRGSSNQRLIDVQASLAQGGPVPYETETPALERAL